MKTSELIKDLEDAGYTVLEDDEQIHARKGGIDLNFGKRIGSGSNAAKELSLIAEYYKTPLDERGSEKKYAVQVLPSEYGYLTLVGSHGWQVSSSISGVWCAYGIVKSRFTQAEIKKLKQRDDIAIDWDKAIIKAVDNNEQ